MTVVSPLFGLAKSVFVFHPAGTQWFTGTLRDPVRIRWWDRVAVWLSTFAFFVGADEEASATWQFSLLLFWWMAAKCGASWITAPNQKLSTLPMMQLGLGSDGQAQGSGVHGHAILKAERELYLKADGGECATSWWEQLISGLTHRIQEERVGCMTTNRPKTIETFAMQYSLKV